jgi:hypothetical protein
MMLTIPVPIEMAIVKAEKALVREKLIDLVVQVANLTVVLQTVTMDAAFRVSNMLFLIRLTTTRLSNATLILDPITPLVEFWYCLDTGIGFGFADKV